MPESRDQEPFDNRPGSRTRPGAIRETDSTPGKAGEQPGTPRQKTGAPRQTGNPEDTAESTGAQEAGHKAGVDTRIVRFLKKHHVLTLATSSEGAPYCCNAFYCYDAERNLLIFTSDMATRHAQQMARNPCVAASVVLETKVVGRVEGLQLCGKAARADEAGIPQAVSLCSTGRTDPVGDRARLYEIHRQHARIREKTDMEQQIGVIIVAGGGGTRMGGSRPKQFTMLGGLPVLAHTINNFAGALPGAEIVVVLPAAHADFWKDFAARFDIAAHTVTTGGDERFHSVKNGLKALKRDPELIAVQDGVRPLASHGMIRRAVAAAAEHGTAIPVVEAVDSYRETDGTASRIADRRRLRIVQTPQVFRADLLRRAYEAEYRPEFTDDASVVEQAGEAVFLCEGERTNLKITTPEDMVIAEALLAGREKTEESADGENL